MDSLDLDVTCLTPSTSHKARRKSRLLGWLIQRKDSINLACLNLKRAEPFLAGGVEEEFSSDDAGDGAIDGGAVGDFDATMSSHSEMGLEVFDFRFGFACLTPPTSHEGVGSQCF